VTRAFFEPTGDPDRFVGTSHCHAPWSPALQHGGPPSALLIRSIERLPSSVDGDAQIARFTVEILGPVPVGEVEVTSRIVRRGRTVELVEAELVAGGRPAMIARAWRMRVARVDLPVPTGVVPVPDDLPGFPQGKVDPPPVPPDRGSGPYAIAMWNTGYADAMEWRFVTGGPGGDGPAAVWARPRIPLVAGETPSPLSRLLLLADAGNGVSRVLDVDAWWFINTELTVHLHRQPAGDWLLLVARSILETNGSGLAETELFDTQGRVGRGAQSLLVGPR
jgi:hypothetical protein